MTEAELHLGLVNHQGEMVLKCLPRLNVCVSLHYKILVSNLTPNMLLRGGTLGRLSIEGLVMD